MERIEDTYGADIRRAARRYAPPGTDWRDVYQETLLGTWDRLRRRKVRFGDRPAMRNTIRQRAIETCRKEVLYRRRFVAVEAVADSALRTPPALEVGEAQRVADMKAALGRLLTAEDARIVAELAWPSRSLREFAAERPTRKTCRRRKRAAPAAVVRRWHVAEHLGVSEARVAVAARRAMEVVPEILGDDETPRTWCQLCSRKRRCRMAECDTRHLHPRDRRLTGRQGRARLSVCRACEARYGKGGR
jgi:DNA-directed RNA polymerase specialized sigma24 family protein